MSDSGKNLPAPPSGTPAAHPTDMKGWLAKWTNYLKGYQKRWFVLHDGLLSYYRSEFDFLLLITRGFTEIALIMRMLIIIVLFIIIIMVRFWWMH